MGLTSAPRFLPSLLPLVPAWPTCEWRQMLTEWLSYVHPAAAAYPQGLLETVRDLGSGLWGRNLDGGWNPQALQLLLPRSPQLWARLRSLPGLGEGRTAAEGGDRPHVDLPPHSWFLLLCSWHLSCPGVHRGWWGRGFMKLLALPWSSFELPRE